MTKRYLTRNIRALLAKGFSAEELRTTICFDEPAFRPVYNQLSREMGKDLIIDRLVAYAYQNSLIDSLLSLLQNLNPACYELHRPYEGELDLSWPEVTTYLERVAEAYRYLPLEGSDQRIPLTDVFVMLQAAQARPRRDVELTEERRGEMGLGERAEGRGSRGAGEQKKGFFARLGGRAKDQAQAEAKSEPPPPPPVEVSEVLSKHPRLVILGEPGSGKTTLLRYIALCLATNQEEAKLKLADPYLPVFLELRRLSSGETVEQLLFKELTAAPYHLPTQTIQEWLNEGRLLVLLDALDEVPLERQTQVREQVERFAASPKWKDNRLVLTSRIAAYREGSGLSVERFSHYTLRPLSGAEDARLYAQGWLQSLRGEGYGGEGKGGEDAKSKVKVEQLIDHMSKQPGLRRVMSNPLQLRLAVAAYYEGGQAALTNRAQLYRRYLEESLRQREAARGACPPWQQVLASLERLAWARHTSSGGRLTQTEATKLLVETKTLKVSETFRVYGPHELLDFLRQRTGLIVEIGQTEQGEPLLAFSHQTYEEYLVARVLSRAWQKGKQQREAVWRILKPRLHHPDWREPILLLAGLLPLAEASDLLHCIHRARSPYDNVLHRDLLLALTCLADGIKVKEEVSHYVVNEAIALWSSEEFGLRYSLLSSALISLLLILPIIYFIHWAIPGPDWLAVSVPIILLCYPLLVYVVLFVVFFVSAIPPFFWLLSLPFRRTNFGHYIQLKGKIRESLEETRNTHAVEPLMGGLRDEIYDVRQVALANALNKLGDTAVEMFMDALGDKDSNVRRVAVWALGELRDARAVESLVAALSDESWSVRQAATEALSKLGNAAVEPLMAALRDKNSNVRKAAAEALGKLRDTRTVEPLMAALHDENIYVGEAAAEALGKLGDARVVEPLMAALSESWGHEHARKGAAKALGKLVTKMTEVQCCTVAHRLWWEAATPDQPDVYEPLLAVATRLVVLEVERLPAPEYPDV